MDIYIPACLIAFAFASKARKGKMYNAKKSFFYTLMAGSPFILVSGLRYYVGTDYGIYKDIFISIKQGGPLPVTVTSIEKGYLWLNKTVALFSADYQSIMIVTAAITIACYFGAIYLLSSDILISVYVWFLSLCFFESMNTVRQSLATALFFVSIYFIYKKKWWWYLLVVLLASCFHRSAIILIFVYWIVNRKSNIRWQLGLIIAAIALSPFFNIFILCLPLPNRYLKYFERVSEFTDFRLMDCVIAVLVWGVAWYFHRFVKTDKLHKYDLFINLQFVTVLIAAVSGRIPMAYRVLQYFVYIPIFEIPEILDASNSIINKKSLKILFTSVYIMQWSYYVFAVKIVDFVRYTSILVR